VDTKEVILVAYTSREAFERSVRTRIATFWSASRNELWIKDKTSGNFFELTEVRVNCEQNSLVYLVRPKGEGICHTRNSKGTARNCYDLDSTWRRATWRAWIPREDNAKNQIP
jgi:phosphoribosyl-AMP cyclohydrolase